MLESPTQGGSITGRWSRDHGHRTARQRGLEERRRTSGRAAALIGAVLLASGGLAGFATGTAYAASCQAAPAGATLTTGTVGATTTCTYTYSTTGEFQFPVPGSVTTLTASAVGGTGGSAALLLGGAPGGFGASVTNARLAVPAGTTPLYVEVAGNGAPGTNLNGSTNSGGGNGGGNGITTGGGGGGASSIQTCSTSSATCTGSYTGGSGDPRLLVAAGGGGSSFGGGATGAGPGGGSGNGGGNPGGAGGGFGIGGGGGGSAGGPGDPGTTSGGGTGGAVGGGNGGGAAPTVAGGGGGGGSAGGGGGGTNGGGGASNGGGAGSVAAGGSATQNNGSGGGGGWFGGGSGANHGGGGAAGSSFAPSGSAATATADTTGKPQVLISYTLVPATMTGSAFGIQASVLGIRLLPPTPNTGPVSTTSASTTGTCAQRGIPGVVAQNLCAQITTTVNPSVSTATAGADKVTFGLPGLPAIVISQVKATSQSSCGNGAPQSTGQAGISELTVAGLPVKIPANIPANTVEHVAGFTVTLNQQIPVTDGLTVNAVHLAGFGLDVIIGSATSDIEGCAS